MSSSDPVHVCDRHGLEHRTRFGGPACVGHSKRTGKCCENAPRPGASVCGRHGAGAPQVRRAAARRLALGRAMGEAGRLLEELGGIRVESADPLRTLSMTVAVSAAMVEVFTDLVAGLNLAGTRIVVEDPDDPESARRVVVDPNAMVGPTHLGDLGVHPYVDLLERWTRNAASIAKQALDAGVSERQIQLAERDVRAMAAGYREFVVGLVDALVAAGVERSVLEQVVAQQAPALMRRALEKVSREETA